MPKKKSAKGKKTPRNAEEKERVTLEAVEAMSSSDEEYDDEGEWDKEALALKQAISDGAFDHLVQKKQDSSDEDDDDSDEEEPAQVDSDEQQQEEEEESESDEEEQDARPTEKALSVVLEEIMTEKKGMPWAETFEIIPSEPLPFADNPLDVHDDLKREVAFYNLALESVQEARQKCNQASIPFSRPDDFFAEMVKTDDHMAKIKDRLIFETKKMDAVAQRKANKEQKLRSKEKHANKLAEKAKRKKEHFRQVDEWAARNNDDDVPNNKKRAAADKKYGYGGKRGRFKQNDPKTLNDMSAFNPRGGNFPGGRKSKGGSGANRKGKRARDAARARR